MFQGNVLPYAPHLYELVSRSVVTTTGGATQITGNNPRRVMLRVTCIQLIAVGTSGFFVNSNQNGDILFTIGTPHSLNLTWINDYNLVGCAIFAKGFGAGSIYNVTELLFNQQHAQESYNVERKPESTTAKIASVSLSKARSSERNYINWLQRTKAFNSSVR